MNKSIPQILKGTCVDLSFEGKGVFKSNKDVVFVDGMFPGEEGEIEITYKRNGALFGKIKKLTKVSKDRIEPKCKVCSACGGCCFQQLSYNAQLEYKTKKKENSMDRYRLVNSHVCASVDNELLNDTIHYIYNTYDTDYIKEIIFMGDCASWIKNFPKSHWFNFSSDTKVMFSMESCALRMLARAVRHAVS